jgi:mannosyltransferase
MAKAVSPSSPAEKPWGERFGLLSTSNRVSLLVLCGVVLLGMWLRWTQLFGQSLWEDEITSGVISESHVGDLMRLTANNDPHPPLYYLISHVAYYRLHLGVVGSLRMPSLAAGAATIAVMYLLGWKLAGRWAGVVAGALIAISPMAVWYSHEGRMYALTWLLVLLSYLLLAQASERLRPVWLALYPVATALALWSDISAFLGVVPQVAVLAALVVEDRRKAWLIAAYVAGFVLYVPWLLLGLRTQWPLLSTQNFHTSSTWSTWSHLLLAQAGLEASYATLPNLLPGAVILLVLFAYAALVFLGWRVAWIGAAYGAALAVGPIALGLLLAVLGSRAVLVPRVEGISSFGVALVAGLLVAAALRSQRRWRVTAAVVAAAVIAGGTSAGLIREIRSGTNAQPWNRWVQHLAASARPGDAVFIYPEALEVAVHAYAPADSPISTQAQASWGMPDQELDDVLLAAGSKRGRLWILYLDNPQVHIQVQDAFLRAHGFRRISGDPARNMGVLGYSRA